MFIKLVSILCLCFTIVSIVYSTFKTVQLKLINIKSKYLQKRERNKKVQNHTTRVIVFTKEEFKKHLINLLLIKSSNHRDVTILLFSLSFILLIVDTPLELKMPKPVLVFLTILFFYSLAKFFLKSFSNFADNLYFYFIKLGILLIFILSFLQVLLTSLETFSLLMTILFTIVFSLVFIRSVLIDFDNIVFQLVNLIFVFVMMLLVVGFSFGIYFLEYNNIFSLYSTNEYQSLMQSTTVKNTDYFFVIYKGLLHFYNFPLEHISMENPKTLILFMEYILGFFYNVILIGFFISYGVSKFTK